MAGPVSGEKCCPVAEPLRNCPGMDQGNLARKKSPPLSRLPNIKAKPSGTSGCCFPRLRVYVRWDVSRRSAKNANDLNAAPTLLVACIGLGDRSQTILSFVYAFYLAYAWLVTEAPVLEASLAADVYRPTFALF